MCAEPRSRRPLLGRPVGRCLELVNVSRCAVLTSSGVRTLLECCNEWLTSLNFSDNPQINALEVFSSSRYREVWNTHGLRAESPYRLQSLTSLSMRNVRGINDLLLDTLFEYHGATNLKKLFLGQSEPPCLPTPLPTTAPGSVAVETSPSWSSWSSLFSSAVTCRGVGSIADSLGWGLEVLDLENLAGIKDGGILRLLRCCPRLRRLLMPGVGISAKPLRAMAIAKPSPRCPLLAELSVRPARHTTTTTPTTTTTTTTASSIGGGEGGGGGCESAAADAESASSGVDDVGGAAVGARSDGGVNDGVQDGVHDEAHGGVEAVASVGAKGQDQCAPRRSPRDAPTAFDREWDTALTLLRKHRTDIPKKSLGESSTTGKVRGGIPRWGSRAFTRAGALQIGNGSWNGDE